MGCYYAVAQTDVRSSANVREGEPVNITRHGRRELVLMSADHYDWLVAAAKRSHRTDHTAGVVLEAVRSAQMDPEHTALDELMK